MIDACSVGIASDTLARDVLASADCLIATQVEQGYAALLAPSGTFVTALTIGLTIYVAIFGYRLILGLSSLTLAEVVPHFIKIGLVLALATSWASYQAVVFDLLFHGPQELANVIVRQAAGTSAAGQGDVLLALQSVFERLTDAAADAWAQMAPAAAAPTAAAAPPVVGAPAAAAVPSTVGLPLEFGAPQFVAALLWFSALMLMAASIGVLLVVRIVLALLLLLGPVFLAFALFRATRGVFEGWLRVTVKFALVPLFALPLVAVVVAVLAPIAATLGSMPVTSVRDSPALLILLVVLVYAAVMVQAARLGGGIAAGIRLPRPAIVPAPQERGASAPTSTAADRIAIATRTDTIVQAIAATGRQGAATQVGTTPAAILATRSITSPAAADARQPSPADNSNRLGQGYRRLVLASTTRTPRI